MLKIASQKSVNGLVKLTVA